MRLDWVMTYCSIIGKIEQGAGHVVCFVHYKRRWTSLVESLAITCKYKYTKMYTYKHVYTHTTTVQIYTHTSYTPPSSSFDRVLALLTTKHTQLSLSPLPSLSSQVPPHMLINRCIFDGQKCTQETYEGDQNKS